MTNLTMLTTRKIMQMTSKDSWVAAVFHFSSYYLYLNWINVKSSLLLLLLSSLFAVNKASVLNHVIWKVLEWNLWLPAYVVLWWITCHSINKTIGNHLLFALALEWMLSSKSFFDDDPYIKWLAGKDLCRNWDVLVVNTSFLHSFDNNGNHHITFLVSILCCHCIGFQNFVNLFTSVTVSTIQAFSCWYATPPQITMIWMIQQKICWAILLLTSFSYEFSSEEWVHYLMLGQS